MEGIPVVVEVVATEVEELVEDAAEVVSQEEMVDEAAVGAEEIGMPAVRTPAPMTMLSSSLIASIIIMTNLSTILYLVCVNQGTA